MSILNVEHLTHGFGDRAILDDVSFRLLKGEHIGLVGANGEGKSTFMNIITGSLMPDEGKIEWAKNVRVGYLDQHAVLENCGFPMMTCGNPLSVSRETSGREVAEPWIRSPSADRLPMISFAFLQAVSLSGTPIKLKL